MILKLLIPLKNPFRSFLKKCFSQNLCLPFLNTFHEKKMSIPSPPPPTYTFFHLDFFRGTGRGRGDKYFMNKKPKNRFNNFETFNPLKKTF